MQLTNIARDVAEDWSRDRLYLPTDWLERIPAAGERLDHASLEPAIRRLLSLADEYYKSGDAGLKFLDRRSRFAIRVARTVYAAIGLQIRRAGCRATSGRAVVPGWRKGCLVLTSLAAECSEKTSRPPLGSSASLGIWEFQPLR
jgi:phytoene synthase